MRGLILLVLARLLVASAAHAPVRRAPPLSIRGPPSLFERACVGEDILDTACTSRASSHASPAPASRPWGSAWRGRRQKMGERGVEGDAGGMADCVTLALRGGREVKMGGREVCDCIHRDTAIWHASV